MYVFRRGVIIQNNQIFSKFLVVRSLFGNADERQAKREKLLKDFKKGSYLADLKEVKATGGKRYLALDEPFPKQGSLKLPNMNGTSISGNKVSLPSDILGNVTLLLLWTREHGQKTCESYRETFSEEFHRTEKTSCYEVNILDSWLFRKMQSYIRSNLKLKIPSDRQDHFLCCYNYTPDVTKTILENSLVGHAVLVDNEGLIRWKAHGTPTTEELTYLINCTNNLRNEIK